MQSDARLAINQLIIQPVSIDDLEEVRKIYNHAVVNSIFTMDLEERTHEEMVSWFKSHIGRYPACVAKINNKMIGIGSLSKWAERKGFYPSCEGSIYLSPEEMAQGHGDAILKWLVSRAIENNFSTIISFMTDKNKLAKNLVKRNGFDYVGVMKKVGYKFDQWIDMAIYQLQLKNINKSE